MKKLICLIAILCRLSAAANEQGYLTTTNTVELADGESLIVLCNLRSGSSSHGISVTFPPYDATFPSTKGYTVYQDSDLAHRTIPGPCRVKAVSTLDMVGYKKTTTPAFTNPMNVIMIPVDYEGDVDISLEASTDLQTWTPLYSGSAGTSNNAAFFRTRLIQN